MNTPEREYALTNLVPEPPVAFGKSSPADEATDQSTISTLSWTASSGASSYEYCIDTAKNNTCDGEWIPVGTNTSAVPDELSVLTTYYWQVRASNPGGTTEADGDAWWNFSTSEFAEGVFDDGFESTAP